MNETATPCAETEILEQIIEANGSSMSLDAAREFLRFRFSDAAVARMNELVKKNCQGVLGPSERALLESYMRVGNFLDMIHAAARCALAEPTSPSS